MENEVIQRAKELEDVYEKELVEVKHDTRQYVDVQEVSIETQTKTIQTKEYVPEYTTKRCSNCGMSTLKEISGHKVVYKNHDIEI